jgi:hypothetical protein
MELLPHRRADHLTCHRIDAKFNHRGIGMRKITAALWLAALSLTAQAEGGRERTPAAVTISGGKIDPIDDMHTTADEGALVWVIGTQGYRFAANDGIRIQSGGKHACKVSPDGHRVRCAKAGHRRGERFKYDVNVIDASGARITLDPWILSD